MSSDENAFVLEDANSFSSRQPRVRTENAGFPPPLAGGGRPKAVRGASRRPCENTGRGAPYPSFLTVQVEKKDLHIWSGEGPRGVDFLVYFNGDCCPGICL
jgi:hypothetical protein